MNRLKALFSSPRKSFLTVAATLLFLSVLGTGSAFAAAFAESSAIGIDNAKKFALADCGVDMAAVLFERVNFGHKQGQFLYEIEFITESAKYEYWVKASDGSILKGETEYKQIRQQGDASEQITLEQAKELALRDAGLNASEVLRFVREGFDIDDGIALYDIEFCTAESVYEYEIRADSGTVYSRSRETVIMLPADKDKTGTLQPAITAVESKPSVPVTVPSQPAEQSLIGLERAKELALLDAGLSTFEADFGKQALEY